MILQTQKRTPKKRFFLIVSLLLGCLLVLTTNNAVSRTQYTYAGFQKKLKGGFLKKGWLDYLQPEKAPKGSSTRNNYSDSFTELMYFVNGEYDNLYTNKKQLKQDKAEAKKKGYKSF